MTKMLQSALFNPRFIPYIRGLVWTLSLVPSMEHLLCKGLKLLLFQKQHCFSKCFFFSKGGEDRSRVGGPENTLLGSSDLSTMIGPGQGAASFDASGNALYVFFFQSNFLFLTKKKYLRYDYGPSMM
jgi:hypothetical protein